MAKEITNHQLGTALASLIDKQEQSQKKALQQMQGIEKNVSERLQELQTLKISVDTGALKQYNDQITTTSKTASERIEKALKAFIISPPVLIFCALLVLGSVLSIWFSLSKVQELQTEKDKMQNYQDNTIMYFKAHPEEWEKVKNWQPKRAKE